MEQECDEKQPVDFLEIKAEPEQFENTVFIEKIESFVKNENPAETEAVYIKVEEIEPPSEIEIVKLEPQASLKPIVALKRLTEANIRRWTRWKHLRADVGGQQKRCYMCDVCGKSVLTKHTIETHLKIHFEPPHLFCDLCPRGFRTLHRVRVHVKTHLRKKPYACKKCDYQTCYRFALVEHNITHSEKTECPLCSKMVGVMKTHMKRMHSTRHRQVQCETCGKAMIKDKLARHVNMVHAKKHQCPKCKEMFTNRGLKAHMLRAHFKGKLHECLECDAIFVNSTRLRTHLLVHSGGTICGVCSREYTLEIALIRHWNYKHRDSLGSYVEWKKNKKHS